MYGKQGISQIVHPAIVRWSKWKLWVTPFIPRRPHKTCLLHAIEGHVTELAIPGEGYGTVQPQTQQPRKGTQENMQPKHNAASQTLSGSRDHRLPTNNVFLCRSYCTSPRLHPKHEPRNRKPEEEQKGRRYRQSGTFPKTLPGTGSRLNSQMLSKRRDGEPILVVWGTLKTRRHPAVWVLSRQRREGSTPLNPAKDTHAENRPGAKPSSAKWLVDCRSRHGDMATSNAKYR